jgi:hypothetical protein
MATDPQLSSFVDDVNSMQDGKRKEICSVQQFDALVANGIIIENVKTNNEKNYVCEHLKNTKFCQVMGIVLVKEVTKWIVYLKDKENKNMRKFNAKKYSIVSKELIERINPVMEEIVANSMEEAKIKEDIYRLDIRFAHMNETIEKRFQDNVFEVKEIIRHFREELEKVNKKRKRDDTPRGVSSIKIIESENGEPNKSGIQCYKCGETTTCHFLDMSKLSRASPNVKKNNIIIEDARKLEAEKAYKEILKQYRMCERCSIMQAGYTMDMRHLHNRCHICRTSRKASNSDLCAECNQLCKPMELNHAISKTLMRRCFDTIPYTVRGIEDIVITEEKQVTVKEDNILKQVAIDTLLEVYLENGKKLVYVIELQNTHKENTQNLTHKYLHTMQQSNPSNLFLWCIRINSNTEDPYDRIEQKLDIVRSWIIVTIMNQASFPKHNHWWFFCQNESPLDTAPKSVFFSDMSVKKITHAPKGDKSNWQYCLDFAPYKELGKKAKKQNHPYEYRRKEVTDLKDLFGPEWPIKVKDLNSGYTDDLMSYIACNNGCKSCKKYITGKE